MKPASLAPVYAVLYARMSEAARSCGYALAVHGSMQRDLDVIAIPWTAEATTAEEVVRAMAETCAHRAGPDLVIGYSLASAPRPHGREGFSIPFRMGGDADDDGYVDVAVMPRASPTRLPEVVGVTPENRRHLAGQHDGLCIYCYGFSYDEAWWIASCPARTPTSQPAGVNADAPGTLGDGAMASAEKPDPATSGEEAAEAPPTAQECSYCGPRGDLWPQEKRGHKYVLCGRCRRVQAMKTPAPAASRSSDVGGRTTRCLLEAQGSGWCATHDSPMSCCDSDRVAASPPPTPRAPDTKEG